VEAGQKKRRLMGDINVVPYIDVMLVLLIIFMVTSQVANTGVELDLPQVDSDAQETVVDSLTLSITKEGEYYLSLGDEEETIDAQTVRLRAAAALRRNPELSVIVRADENLPVGSMVEAMALLQAAGAPNVSIATKPPE